MLAKNTLLPGMAVHCLVLRNMIILHGDAVRDSGAFVMFFFWRVRPNFVLINGGARAP